MKKLLLLLTILTGFYTAKASINFALDYAGFSAENQAYFEFYLSINGNSISYGESTIDLFQANIEVTYVLEQEGKVVTFEKFQIKSPEYKLEDLKLELIDLKRIPVKSGSYNLSLKIKDLISNEEVERTFPLKAIFFSREKLSISDIELADAYKASSEESIFVKNGIEITPNIAHVYDEKKNKLAFYFEIYNANESLKEDEGYLIEYKVVNKESQQIVNNLRAVKRVKANELTPIISSFTLSNLPADFYELQINAIDRNNKIITSKSTEFFMNSNSLSGLESVMAQNTFVDSIKTQDEMMEHIKSLQPISSSEEYTFSENQLEYSDFEFMKKYFYNFWKVRNNLNPERAWLDYKEQLRITDKEFGYAKIRGFQTERGRVYLQYGQPNAVQDVPYDNNTFPYSIWQYYKIKGLTDRKFIFFSPSMEMLGYEVLHSNVPGERNNPNWEQQLISKTSGNRFSIDGDGSNDVINENSRTLFDNPR